jgi:hypothetical protein
MRKAMRYNDDGSPRYIRCYKTEHNPAVDRYTAVFTKVNCFMEERGGGRFLLPVGKSLVTMLAAVPPFLWRYRK